MHWTMPFRAPVGLLAAAALGIGLFFLSSGAGQDTPPTAIPVRVIIVGSAAEAGKILEQLKSGADFAVLAREKSVDATSVDGGFMGNVNPATLRAELRDALQGLGAGQLSAVVKLPAGFAILKVLQPKEIPDLDDAEQARQFAISALGSVRGMKSCRPASPFGRYCSRRKFRISTTRNKPANSPSARWGACGTLSTSPVSMRLRPLCLPSPSRTTGTRI